MSLAFVLFVIFLILKLVGVIAWSWWLVTLPLWAGFALTLAIAILAGIFGGTAVGIVKVLDHHFRR